MRNQDQVTFDQLKLLKKQFDQWIEKFNEKDYTSLKKIITDIEDEVSLLFLVSEERYAERLSNREILNKHIKQQNIVWKEEAKLKYISDNPKEILAKLAKISVDIDDDWWVTKWKSKKIYIKNFISTWFQPKPIITSDKYPQATQELLLKAKNFVDELTETLETTKSNSENFFQNYDNLAQLFFKLGIQPQSREYDLFSKWVGKPREKTWKKIEDMPKEVPEFKKIGYLFKYIEDKKIPINPRHILRYPDWSLCIYLQSKNITILISDEIWSNKCFRDATYIIKWPILENQPMTKETVGEYEGKRIMFSDNRGNRIEDILTQNPDTREKIKTENGIQEDDIQKELITDKNEFISIIKQNFTQDNLNTNNYQVFVEEYNTNPQNAFLLRANFLSNYALLWLPRHSSTDDVRKTIRWKKISQEKNNKGNFMGNDFIKEELTKLRNYSDFDPQKDLWMVAYTFRLKNILKIVFDTQDLEKIKSIKRSEKKQKLLEILWMDLPHTGETLSVWLGWMACSIKDYQTLLRKRFCLSLDKKQETKEYITLCDAIQKYEETFLQKSVIHSKSRKKVEIPSVVKTANDDIATSFETPKDKKPIILSKKETQIEKLTIDDIKKFKVYTGKIKSISHDKMHITINDSDIVWKVLNFNKWHKIGDEIEVMVLDIKESIKDNKKYPLLRISKYTGNGEILKFCEGKTFSTNSLLVGSKYTWIINNITETKVRVSLSRHCSGFIDKKDIPDTQNIKVGSVLRVKFIQMSWEIPKFKFV